MLDGVDSFIYALVLVPAMKEILPRSGIEASAGNLGYFGSILFSMFLIGWGLAFLWGPLAEPSLTARVWRKWLALTGVPVPLRGIPLV